MGRGDLGLLLVMRLRRGGRLLDGTSEGFDYCYFAANLRESSPATFIPH
jgi:hypothetical protein